MQPTDWGGGGRRGGVDIQIFVFLCVPLSFQNAKQHHNTKEKILNKIKIFKRLKKRLEHCKFKLIYFNCVIETPRYNIV